MVENLQLHRIRARLWSSSSTHTHAHTFYERTYRISNAHGVLHRIALRQTTKWNCIYVIISNLTQVARKCAPCISHYIIYICLPHCTAVHWRRSFEFLVLVGVIVRWLRQCCSSAYKSRKKKSNSNPLRDQCYATLKMNYRTVIVVDVMRLEWIKSYIVISFALRYRHENSVRPHIFQSNYFTRYNTEIDLLHAGSWPSTMDCMQNSHTNTHTHGAHIGFKRVLACMWWHMSARQKSCNAQQQQQRSKKPQNNYKWWTFMKERKQNTNLMLHIYICIQYVMCTDECWVLFLKIISVAELVLSLVWAHKWYGLYDKRWTIFPILFSAQLKRYHSIFIHSTHTVHTYHTY